MNRGGELLAQLRKEAGMTQAELGRALDMLGRDVSKYELGVHYPSFQVVSGMVHTLDLDQPTEARLKLAFGYAPDGWDEIADKLDAMYQSYMNRPPKQDQFPGFDARIAELMTAYGDWLGENDENDS